MAKPIKLFQPTEKVYRMLGIETSQPELKDRVSFRWFFLLTSMIIYLISSTVFLISEAKSVADLGDSFYEATSDISCIFHIITYCREAPKLRQLIGKFESFFQESKLRFSVCHFQTMMIKNQKIKDFGFTNFLEIPRIELKNPTTAVKFIELHEKIDRLCELLYCSLVKISSPLFILPNLFATISNFFASNLGDESFILPSPIS